ncbi:B mating type pheromone precursor [Gelatoporia subvermispora B]|uniref:B mating type pheromone n=1 Tax=Ceriporiopsis subvermispora (strain B) TaxID=914234 RepID=M2R9V2_CERS8|nr:B mating type pheromone precursor [Gelatoporia subvermispora B]
MDAFFTLAAPVPSADETEIQVPVDEEQFGSSTTSQHCIIA